MKPSVLVACDFDGTVTRQDTLVEILNRYGAPGWKEIQARVVSGALSIREGLKQEMATVRASQAELETLLRTEVQLDLAFPAFLKRMQAQGIPVVLLSGGFNLCVEAVMRASGLWPVPYLANRIEQVDDTWQVEFPYPSATCQDCGHCKADPIRTWNTQGYTTLFVGNGVTDRCPAKAATHTFAKDELSCWCKQEGITTLPFETFEDIEKTMQVKGWL